MKKNQIFAILAVAIVIIAAVGVVFVLNNDGSSDENPETTVTDSLGRTVSIPMEINSIFCIGACSLRLVSYFESVDKVQAIETAGTFNTRDDQTYYLINKGTFSSLPQVATTAEGIVSLNPDLVITSTATDAGTADNLQTQTGVPVYAINANLEFGEAFYDQISSIGTLLGEKERSAELNEGITAMINEITLKSTTPSSMSGYACGMFYYGGASLLKASGNYLPFDYSNVTNAIEPAANGQPYMITLETLISVDPDYMYIDSIGLSTCLDSIHGYIDDNTGLENISAIKNDRLYSVMVYKCYGTNWENQLINVYYVASKMNGGLYSWTFEEKANAIVQLFYPNTNLTYSDIVDGQSGSGCGKVTL